MAQINVSPFSAIISGAFGGFSLSNFFHSSPFDHVQPHRSENFTGLSPLRVRQDFHAAILLSNLIAASFYDASRRAAQHSEGKKWEYKPNDTETYRELRGNVFDLILADSEYAYGRAYRKLQREIGKSLIPVRNDCHPKNGKPRHSPRFFHNHKPS